MASTPQPHPARPETAPPWHTLSANEAAARIDTGPHGLSRDEAKARLQVHGPNMIEEVPPPGAFTVFINQFRSPVIFILLIATVVTLALEEWVDAAVIAAVLALNAAIGFTQERRAESSVRALMGLVSPHALVVREGREWDIASSDVVPGDLVLLESGVRVAADLRLLSSNALEIDESLLTGESLPVAKDAEHTGGDALGDRHGMAYAGSVVTSGRARGYAVATGMTTELGAIAGHMRAQEVPETPLQRQMRRFAQIIGIVVGISSAAAFVVGVTVGESVSAMFIVAVALAVAAVPEGLPVAFTITLALGVRRMARRNAIVRRLPAVETLGSTTVIGSDKTGTLTENRMTVREIWAGGELHRAEGTRRGPGTREIALDTHDPVALTLLAGILTNEASFTWTADGHQTTGDPTETALLIAAAQAGLEPEAVRDAFHTDAEIPFESHLQFSASFRSQGGRRFVFVKGAPERLVGMSAHLLTPRGPEPLDAEAVLAQSGALAGRGLRVLAMAYRELDAGEQPGMGEPSGLTLLGLQGLMDPPRAGVREAIAGCHEAGIRVVMITGDHASTAAAIAGELGIMSGGERVLTGVEVERMSAEDLRAAVRDTAVYARVSPEHKLRVVEALRAQGEVVAVTGDGVNDAPALRAADIGIAMGRSGTDVAREAADMVLADDNFVSIYAAVEEGRVTFSNVRKVTFFLLSTGVASIIAIIAALAFGWPVPMVAAQLLWLNLVTNGLQDVALAFEPGEKGMLKRPPRSNREGVISRLLWERTLLAGTVMAIGTLILFRWELDQGGTLVQAQTVALTTLVFFQVFHVGNSRSETLSVLQKSPLSNRFLFIATVASVAVHVTALYLPPTQYVLRLEPLELAAWPRVVLMALTVVLAVEAHKYIRNRWRAGVEPLAPAH